MFGRHLLLHFSTFLWLFIHLVSAKVQHDPGRPMPSFVDPVKNITVIKGRSIIFTCIVKNLGPYKVGWVKADTKAIQAIHHQVVTHNPRVSVTYRDHTTWNLHIRDVQTDDRGIYMCQVNTDPMLASMASLEVQVPPEIIDEESSGETIVVEGGNAHLFCQANGYPTPTIYWKRERASEQNQIDDIGENLTLTRVMRSDMGHYLCIGKNGVPPSVSKRILLSVHFEPLVTLPINMFSFPEGDVVTIRCRVESSPRAVTTWKKVPEEQMIISSNKYDVRESHHDYYVTMMNLTIKNFTMKDATNYLCSASNSLGASDATITVNAIAKPKTPKPEIVLRPPSNAINNNPSQMDNNVISNVNPFDTTDSGLFPGDNGIYGNSIHNIEGGAEMLDSGGGMDLGVPPGIGEPYPGVNHDFQNSYSVFSLFGDSRATTTISQPVVFIISIVLSTCLG